MGFAYRDGALCAEEVPLEDIARRFGTPCYVYSAGEIEAAFAQFRDSLAGRDALVCYSVKANSNLSVLALLARLGAGFDIVSGGELLRVLAAGGDPGKMLFSGVGKSQDEIALAIEKSIHCINLESEQELERVAAVARRLGRQAPVAFRVNPEIDARTHPYISTALRESKFGVAHADAPRLYARAAAMPELHVLGIGCHIGSQLMDSSPFVTAAERIVALAERLREGGFVLRHIDVGGGIGIAQKEEAPDPVRRFVEGAIRALDGRDYRLIFDPGRSIVGNAGVLLTRIEYVKHGEARSFAVVDAAMNDLIRPALYGAWHDVKPVRQALAAGCHDTAYDIVGPVCESADFLARARPITAQPGELLAVMSAGAYGMAMSSNYNSRPRAAEVMVRGREAHLVRRRETIAELMALESIAPYGPEGD